jgi:hypothetical protein
MEAMLAVPDRKTQRGDHLGDFADGKRRLEKAFSRNVMRSIVQETLRPRQSSPLRSG